MVDKQCSPDIAERSAIARALKENLIASTDAAGTPIISGFNSAVNAILAIHAQAARALRPEALQALKGYIQADADGVMVYVSRQALDEAIAALDVAQPSGETEQQLRESNLSSLLREARQYVSDAYCNEEDNEVHGHSKSLLDDIDRALAIPSTDLGSRLTFCEACNGNTMHRRAAVVDGVQTFECQRCAMSSPQRESSK